MYKILSIVSNDGKEIPITQEPLFICLKPSELYYIRLSVINEPKQTKEGYVYYKTFESKIPTNELERYRILSSRFDI